jgi:hypothetical protein
MIYTKTGDELNPGDAIFYTGMSGNRYLGIYLGDDLGFSESIIFETAEILGVSYRTSVSLRWVEKATIDKILIHYLEK